MLTRAEIEERLVVLDTPGFHDEPRKEREALDTAQQLAEWLELVLLPLGVMPNQKLDAAIAARAWLNGRTHDANASR